MLNPLEEDIYGIIKEASVESDPSAISKMHQLEEKGYKRQE